MGEKAKYIEDKEKTLYNDLEKVNKKFKEIANWYGLSDYKLNSKDEKNIRIYIQKVNDIYSELRALLINTKQIELYKKLNELVTLTSLEREMIEK